MDENDLIKMMSQLVGGGGLQGTVPDPQMEILKQGVDTTTKAYEDLLAQQQAQNEPPTGFMAKINNAFNSPATAAALKLIEEGNRKRGLQEGPGTLLGAMPPAVNAFNTQYKSLQDQQTSRLKALMESAQAKRAAQLEMDQFGLEQQKAASEHQGRMVKGIAEMYKAMKPPERVRTMEWLNSDKGKAALAEWGMTKADFLGKLYGHTTINNSLDKSTPAGIKQGHQLEYAAKWMEAHNAEAEKKQILAEDMMNMMSLMQTPGFDSGKLSKLREYIHTFLRSAGVPEDSIKDFTNLTDQGAAAMQVFDAMGNKMALIYRNPDSGLGLPGAASDRDVEFLKSMVPNLKKTPEANQLLMKIAIKNAKVTQAYHKYAERVYSEYDGTGVSLPSAIKSGFKDSPEYQEYMAEAGEAWLTTDEFTTLKGMALKTKEAPGAAPTPTPTPTKIVNPLYPSDQQPKKLK